MAIDEYILSLRKDFFEEAFEMLERLESNILNLSNNYEDSDAIQEIFRAVHTLKGSAGAVELTEVSSYTHRFEDLLDLIRNNEIKIDDETIDVLLRGIDNIKDLVEAAYDERDATINVANELEIIENFRKEKLSKDNVSSKLDEKLSEDKSNEEEALIDLNLDNDLIETIRTLLENGLNIYTVFVDFDIESPMRTVGGVQVFVNLKDIGDVISTVPPLTELEGDEFYPSVIYVISTDKNKDKIQEYITIEEITKSITIEDINIEEYVKFSRDKNVLEVVKEQDELKSEEDKSKKDEDISKNKKQVTSDSKKDKHNTFLRVESDRIDAMMNQVGELVINKSAYQQYEDDFLSYSNNISIYLNELKKYFRTTVLQTLKKLENTMEKQELKDLRNEILDEFNGHIKNIAGSEAFLRLTVDKYRSSYQILSRVTSDIQATVMKIRMVPIAQNFNRFPRLIRDLARDMGKEVALEIIGEDTELDKSVIEVLVDPMIHLVRNAMDHGIESPEERERSGKARLGKIKLMASHEGNLIIIKITDDGKGMIPEQIFKSAVKKGIVNANEILTDREKIDLIFAAGFSTAEKITSVSGRGVGMDVVKKSLEKINGSITVDTEFGKGSVFSLRIPLTLAIIEALIVDVEQEYYAVPVNSIVETLCIDSSSVYELESAPVINIRDEIIGVVRLKDIFSLPSRYEKDSEYAVIISFENTKVALLVNTLVGEQDIVIKALNDKIAKTEGIVGATILGDGTVSFILDIQDIVMSASIKTTKENVLQKKFDLKSFINSLKHYENNGENLDKKIDNEL